MIKKFFPFILFILSVQLSLGQDKGDYRAKFTEGSYLILEENYVQALKNFLAAYQIDSTNSNINYKIGYCYLNTETEKEKALYYLEKGVKNVEKKYLDMEPSEKTSPVNAYYYYGRALHQNYRFDEAIANYEKFKSYLVPGKNDGLIKDVDRQIEISNYAKIMVAAPGNFIIKNLGDSINTRYPEYSPVISADEKTLIFTSRRPGSTGGDKTIEDQFYEDIYISTRKNDSSWTTPVSISPNINTVTHEATVGLTADAQTLLIYKDVNGGDIYYSTLDGENWTFPQAMGSDINTSHWETSACLTPDGSTIYFVSDRPGGMGGRDIWKCVKLPNGKWSLAVNLGPPINTIYDEESPFIHPSGNILFFSSKGHQTIGGFDIFFSNKDDDGKWEEPLNIGYPINTTDDDVFYVSSPDGKRGYYSSSSRPEGYGEKDIYMITIPERKEQPLVLIKGVIIPVDGQQLPPNLEIVATNNETGIVTGVYKPMLRDGSFTIIIPPGSNYTLSYTNDGQEFFSEIMEVPADAAYQEINREVRLKPVNFGTLLPKDSLNANGNQTIATLEYLNIGGKLVDPNNSSIGNTPVNLFNSQGEKIQAGFTNENGEFKFTHLPTHHDYTVSLNEGDPNVLGKKSMVEFSDDQNNPLKSKISSGKFIQPDSKVSVFIQTKKLKPVATVVHHEQLATVDALNFTMNFKYNVTQIDVNDGPFKEFIENLVNHYNQTGSLSLSIYASASQVPTRAYKSNKDLAIARAKKAKEQVMNALKEKGIDSSKINFVKTKALVDGPVYSTDYLINRALYEKYQFVKIGVK